MVASRRSTHTWARSLYFVWCGVVCICVSEWVSEWEREDECVCVCVCVWARAHARMCVCAWCVSAHVYHWYHAHTLCICARARARVCVCVCVNSSFTVLQIVLCPIMFAKTPVELVLIQKSFENNIFWITQNKQPISNQAAWAKMEMNFLISPLPFPPKKQTNKQIKTLHNLKICVSFRVRSAFCYKVLRLLHLHFLSLNREGRWGTTDKFTTNFLHFSLFSLPSGTWRIPGLSIPGCCLPNSSCVY